MTIDVSEIQWLYHGEKQWYEVVPPEGIWYPYSENKLMARFGFLGTIPKEYLSQTIVTATGTIPRPRTPFGTPRIDTADRSLYSTILNIDLLETYTTGTATSELTIRVTIPGTNYDIEPCKFKVTNISEADLQTL